LEYAGTIDHGLSDQKEEYSRGFRQTRGIIGPEGVYLDGGSAWVPRFRDEMIRFTVEVRGPDDWHVISQGNGASDVEPGLARWQSGGELEQVYLVGGPLVVERESAGAVEALVYLHEPDLALARKYLDATARYLEMYRQLIGPYPYGKFALVENFWETGYGMPSFTLLGEQVIRLPFILHSSYPHEILHNWWGNSVFVDYESGNWCEGLTAYLADHLVQEQRGAGTAYRRGALQKYLSYVKEGRDFPLAEFRNRHSAATEAVGYGKSLMLFHMLRREIGDDAYRRVLADFYRTNRGRRASFDDIRASVESVTGDDFEAFFAQWVECTRAPRTR
ncbi:MAG: M1 family metallopeptidase, partial [Planctomycetota bacterium]